MNLIRAALARDSTDKRPVLFYGPPNSGKTTAVRTVLEQEHNLHTVLVHDRFLNHTAPLQARTQAGPTAYIVKLCNSVQPLPAAPGATVVYTCVDPFQRARKDQLQRSFRLVDLSRSFASPSGESDNAHLPPWQALDRLCEARGCLAAQLATLDANPQLFFALHSNLGLACDLEQCVSSTAKISQLDTQRFPDQTGLLLQTLSLLHLRDGPERLNWRSAEAKKSTLATGQYAFAALERPQPPPPPSPRPPPTRRRCEQPAKRARTLPPAITNYFKKL